MDHTRLVRRKRPEAKFLHSVALIVPVAACAGCRGPAGLPGSGVYTNKDTVDGNGVTLLVDTAGGFFLSGTALCDETNGLLLYGGCWSQGGGTRMYQSYPWLAEESSQRSGWYGTFQTETPLVVGANAGLVKVCCLKAP
jgi:hypothetical protein